MVIGWYSDGVRLVDISDPTAPVETAYLVPAPTPDPYGIFATNAFVWGATFGDVDENEYIFASDINYGLYVMQVTAGR